MSRLKQYIEMAYRGGESYSGRELLTQSAVGKWIYDKGIRSRDVFQFTNQRTYFWKQFKEGLLQMNATVSKSDPTLKNRLLKLIKEKCPEVLKENDGDFYFMYGWFRADGYSYGDELDRKKIEKQAEKIKNVLTSEGWDFKFDKEHVSFTFTSSITFNKISWAWKPKEEGAKWSEIPVRKKSYSDKEYRDLLASVYDSSDKLSEAPTEIRASVLRLTKVTK